MTIHTQHLTIAQAPRYPLLEEWSTMSNAFYSLGQADRASAAKLVWEVSLTEALPSERKQFGEQLISGNGLRATQTLLKRR